MGHAITLLSAVLAWSVGSGGRARAEDGPQPPPEDVRVARLAGLGKLWGFVRYFHPYLAYKGLDWDAALAAAIPEVDRARSREEYADAVQVMLDALGDPATRVIRQPAGRRTGDAGRPPDSAWLEGEILAIRITDYSRLGEATAARAAIERLTPDLVKARGVILDLRALVPIAEPETAREFVESIGGACLPRPATEPSERHLYHSSYATQRGPSSGGYFSAFKTEDGRVWRPIDGVKPKRVAFLVNDRSILPRVARALQGRGDGAVIAEGKVSEALVTTTRPFDLGEGLKARVRVTEVVGAPPGPLADVEVPARPGADVSSPAYQAALNFLRGDGGPTSTDRLARADPPPLVRRLDLTYENEDFPCRAHRLLAVFRLWNTIHYFFPYKHLMEEDWGAVLAEFVPRIERARDPQEYALTLAEMATHTHDSHVGVHGGRGLDRLFGVALPPIEVRMVEGVPAVARLFDEAAKASGIEVGDVLLEMDGESVAARMQRFGKYVAASTPQSLASRTLVRILTGPEGSTLVLKVRARDGGERRVELPRRVAYNQQLRHPRAGDVVKVLPGGVGYVDLDRLTVGQVEAMFERLKDTKAIIFDMRGYPNGVFAALASRLNVRGASHAASIRRPIVDALAWDEKNPPVYEFLQPIPGPFGRSTYAGKTVMLIDERAISQSEHTGLFLEVACGTTFIGSPTAGANGDLTTLTVPGGLWITFSGQDIRHADGRQLQRKGLVPDIRVDATIRGLRDGRDEVLERALEYLQSASTK